jgi:hypothetical protein
MSPGVSGVPGPGDTTTLCTSPARTSRCTSSMLMASFATTMGSTAHASGVVGVAGAAPGPYARGATPCRLREDTRAAWQPHTHTRHAPALTSVSIWNRL